MFSATQNFAVIFSKIQTNWRYYREVLPKDADRMANSADPDQTAPDLDLLFA